MPTPTIVFQADPLLSGASKIIIPGEIVANESSIVRSLACQMACFFVFDIEYPRTADDYFIFCQLQILKIPSVGDQEG